MANDISKTEYLKRYFEKEAESEKKRKKKAAPKSLKLKVNVPCLKIVDKDIDLKSINFGDKAEEEEGDEAPVVAEIIDERPLEAKLKEMYESSRWKKINNNGSSQSDLVGLQNNNSNESARKRHDSDSDISPMREQKHSYSDISPPRNHKQIKSRHDSESDASPPRTHKQSTKKKSKRDSDTSISPSLHQSINRRNNQVKKSSRSLDSDSDISPPRHQTASKKNNQVKISSRRHDSDSDLSPPRHHIATKQNNQVKKSSRRLASYSDNSPVRQSNNLHESKRHKMGHNSDSDLSPPRSSSDLSSIKGKSKKLVKTLSGLKAGLQNSKSLQQEVQELRKREKNALNMLDDDVSGRNADTVIRDRKTGLIKDFSEELEAKKEKEKKTKEYQQKYDKWGKGMEQSLDKMEKFKDDLYEMSKPLARYKDDEDLDERLKAVIHDDDPMSAYIKKKRQKDVPNYPVYSGPPAPPNRFGINPGYRWDGVDRSNGFEKKYFEKINTTKAVQDEAYMWSVQDM